MEQECKYARGQMVKRIFGPPEVEGLLEEHVRNCPDCAARLAAYRRIRDDVGGLEPVPLPEQVEETLAERMELALAEGPDEDLVPARPEPEIPGAVKAAIAVGALLALVGLTMLVMVVFRGDYEPPAPAAVLTSAQGEVQVQDPGSSRWREARAGESLMPGAMVRAEGDGAALLSADSVWWRLDGFTALALGMPGEFELLQGRLYGDCRAPDDEPVHLLSQQGSIECTEGRFVAVLTPERLRVTCLSGEVNVRSGDEEQILAPGSRTMVHKGRPAGPARDSRLGEAEHWLKAFDEDGERILSRRQLASVPVTDTEARLPAGIRVEDLEVDLRLRGALALVQFEVRVRNDAAEPWEGSLRPAEALLPLPLAQVSEPMRVEPGERAIGRAAALCVLTNREGAHSLGLNLRNWTSLPVESLRLAAEVKVEGGISELELPLHGVEVRNRDEFTWSWRAEGVEPAGPIVLEYVPRRDDMVDALRLTGGQEDLTVVGWRPRPRPDEWPGRNAQILIAFDATADFGPGGHSYAQDVLEEILGALPTGSYTALAVYDGRVKLDPDPLLRHFPARVETMLAALWQLEGQAAEPVPFFESAIALAAGMDGPGSLLYVTGRGQQPPEPEPLPEGMRVFVLRLGVDEVNPQWGEFCAGAGEALAAALPQAMAPRMAALDFLSNLRWPTLMGAPALRLAGGRRAVLLAGPGQFANQPVVAICRTPGGGSLAGEFQAAAGGRELEREFALRPSRLGGPLVEELVLMLRSTAGL